MTAAGVPKSLAILLFGTILASMVLIAPTASFAATKKQKQCQRAITTVFTFKKGVPKKKRKKAVKLICQTMTIGAPGPKGSPGARGPAGPVGATGATGEGGMAGATGATGTPGLPGLDGLAGPTGPTGLNGQAGPTGLTGPTGLPGLDGLTGPTGPTGLIGPTGVTGSTGPTGALPTVIAMIPWDSPQSMGGTINTITGWTEEYDPSGNFDPVSGTFTAPSSGDYLIEPDITTGPSSAVTASGGQPPTLLTNVNGIGEDVQAFPLFNTDLALLSLVAPLQTAQVSGQTFQSLNAGDQVQLQIIKQNGVGYDTYGDLKITRLP